MTVKMNVSMTPYQVGIVQHKLVKANQFPIIDKVSMAGGYYMSSIQKVAWLLEKNPTLSRI